MNMKKLIQTMTDIENNKSQLSESTVEACGDIGSMSMPAQNAGNPVTASITLNASGMDHVADLMRLLQQAGLEKAGPVAAAPLPMRADMEQLRDKMNGLEAPVSAPKEQYFDVDTVTAGGDDIHSRKEPEDIRVKDGSISHEIRNNEEFANEPDEEYSDHLDMIKRLSGGLNREKKSYAAAQPGDNAMAVEGAPAISPKFIKHLQVTFGDKEMLSRSEERKVEDMLNKLSIEDVKTLVGADIPHISDKAKEYMRDNTPGGMKNYGDNAMAVESKIKAQLYKALSEKKAKPDFLDIDGDGDTKEPMKKAAQDAKKGSAKDTDNKTKGLSDKQKKLPAGLQKAIAKKKTNEGAPAISPKFIKNLQVIFGDKEMLSPGETRKVEDMINKLSIEDVKTLVGADIPHVSDMAKEYMRDNTPGGMKNYGDNAMAVEGDLDEAYVNTSKDAMDTLSALRKIGKSIERGQGSYDGNLANMYASDVYDVYSFIEKQTNGFQGIDKNTKTAIDAMMTLRGQAKKMERELGSGKNARFGNDIATTLYPVMSWLSSTNFDRNQSMAERDVDSNFELTDTARKATAMAQKIKRKINSGEQMDDLDYNQMAELGTTLSRLGASFGPKNMKDVLKHMQDYTNERNQEGNKYPEFTVDRFKELISMASSTGESAVSEISPDLAKRYTKAAKMDRDFNDDDIDRLSKSGQSTRDMQRRNSLRTKGMNQAAKRIDR